VGLLGIIWGIWHWPVFIPVYTSILNTSGSSPMEAFVATLVQLVTYIFGAMVGEAFIYTWLYNRTRSVFLCILFHVFHNMAGTYVEMLVPSAGSYVPILGGIMQWVIAIYLMRNCWVETTPETSAGGKV
jgi:membrane protease YdiL (CAAX protease family)